jgi:hypothetical protein
LAYAAGQLIAAFGNAIEKVLWWFRGGMPLDWVTIPNTALLSAQQIDQIEQKVRSRFGTSLATVRNLELKIWWPISRQIYGDVMKNGKVERIDTFNGNYGLNRGLCATSLILAMIAFGRSDVWMATGLLLVSCGYLYRAHRFGVHYARELYVQFLLLP